MKLEPLIIRKETKQGNISEIIAQKFPTSIPLKHHLALALFTLLIQSQNYLFFSLRQLFHNYYTGPETPRMTSSVVNINTNNPSKSSIMFLLPLFFLGLTHPVPSSHMCHKVSPVDLLEWSVTYFLSNIFNSSRSNEIPKIHHSACLHMRTQIITSALRRHSNLWEVGVKYDHSY